MSKSERIKRLRFEQNRFVSEAELDTLKAKYRLWKVLTYKETNCNHCLYKGIDCAPANRHFDYEGKRIYQKTLACICRTNKTLGNIES